MSSNFFKGNRDKLRRLVKLGAPIVLTANGLMQKSADETYAFRQESNFWYLTGVQEPNIVLVMDKSDEYLIVPELSHAKEMFDGAIDVSKVSKVSGINEILNEKLGWERLSKRLKATKEVAIIEPSPEFIDVLGMYTNPSRQRIFSQIKEHNPGIKAIDVREYLQQMRMVKHPSEIKAIKQAVKITSHALRSVKDKYLKGDYGHEFEIYLDLSRSFWEQGAEGHAYDPIVAGAGRAAQIHYMKNDSVIKPIQPVLLDVGASYGHYAADITRCWALEPSERYLRVYEAVAQVHKFALNILRPGVVLSEYEKEVEKAMGVKLLELGLIKSADSESVRRFYPHRTSHYLGIDVHDFGNYDKPLTAGCVLTVEPGIYIPEEAIGIRLEDDIIITKTGHENLSASLPLSLS